MDAETTDSWVGLNLELPWRWCLVALLPVALFFAASVVRAKQAGGHPNAGGLSGTATAGLSGASATPR